jgi:hypothetical protein
MSPLHRLELGSITKESDPCPAALQRSTPDTRSMITNPFAIAEQAAAQTADVTDLELHDIALGIGQRLTGVAVRSIRTDSEHSPICGCIG